MTDGVLFNGIMLGYVFKLNNLTINSAYVEGLYQSGKLAGAIGLLEAGKSNVIFATQITGSVNEFGAPLALIHGGTIRASVLVNDIALKGSKFGGVVGHVNAGAVVTLVNCIGKIEFKPGVTLSGTTVGFITSGNVNGHTSGLLNEIDGATLNNC